MGCVKPFDYILPHQLLVVFIYTFIWLYIIKFYGEKKRIWILKSVALENFGRINQTTKEKIFKSLN